MQSAILSLRNVNVYQDKTLVLKNVNLEVKPGEFIYMIGKTGSGKSSLLKTLYADLPLVEGEADIVNFNLKTLKEKDIPFLRRNIGIVFQDFKLLPDRNIYKNLEFVLQATGWKEKSEIDLKISEVLEKVSMGNSAQKMPHQLSGGEQQRIAIARALLNNPDIILADEPTGNLDPHTSVEIMEVLREINRQGKTIVMVTHDYAILLKFPSKTLKCEDQTIFEVVQRS
nr:ATP-binding cassette domain-containing protein [uncultured Flavobacterium sp.]